MALSPLAVAQALRPGARPENFRVIVASAAPAQPPRGAAPALVSGSGICGVAILSGRTLGTVEGRGACGVENAVEITAVGGIRLGGGVTVDCQTASALADWVERVANPAVGDQGGGLARIDVGGGYSCRGRNNVAGARLSEHAFGHAIDVMGVTLRDGTRLSVLGNWGNALLREMHRGACGIFGTVLGPDANRAHRDHFHFDTARYRSGSYCR
ncbi:MAG: extensin family protein [Rubellimicrobium sp.]|nr:extensin family protein [Rubellimicrobium sp.]